MNKFNVVAAALALCAFTGTASADSLSSRAVTTLGAVIAAQGNAALIEIRKEIAASALAAVKPILPEPKEVEQQPARKQPTRKLARREPIQHSL